jgi:outer membrane protein assembly factor BamB
MTVPCQGGSAGRWRPNPPRLAPPLELIRAPRDVDDFDEPPVVGEKFAYGISHKFGIFAFDLKTGNAPWLFGTKRGWGACQLWDGKLLTVPAAGKLVVLNADSGAEIEAQDAGDLRLNYSAILDDTIVAPLDLDLIGAWSLKKHEWLWRVRSGWNLTLIAAAGDLITIAEDRAYVGLDLKTGAERWRFDVREMGDYRNALGDLRAPEATAHAIATADSVYAAVTGGWLMALDAATGRPRWTHRADTIAPRNFTLASSNDLLLISNDTLIHFDARTGATLSKAALPTPTIGPYALMAVSDEFVWVCQGEGRIAALGRTTGKIEFLSEPVGRASRAPVLHDHGLLTIDDAGRLAMFVER